MTWLRDNNTHCNKPKRHPKCKGWEDRTPDAGVEFECGYESDLTCDECKYGLGRKDPEAKCNQPE